MDQVKRFVLPIYILRVWGGQRFEVSFVRIKSR